MLLPGPISYANFLAATILDHAAFTLNGVPKTVAPFRKIVEGEMVNIYVYFDDTVKGTVADTRLIDVDGDVVAAADWAFDKPTSKGLYIAFKYQIIERETEVKVTDGTV